MENLVVAIVGVCGNDENPTASNKDGAINEAVTNMTKAQDIALDSLDSTEMALSKNTRRTLSSHISVLESEPTNDLVTVDPKLVELTFYRIKHIKQS